MNVHIHVRCLTISVKKTDYDKGRSLNTIPVNSL